MPVDKLPISEETALRIAKALERIAESQQKKTPAASKKKPLKQIIKT